MATDGTMLIGATTGFPQILRPFERATDATPVTGYVPLAGPDAESSA